MSDEKPHPPVPPSDHHVARELSDRGSRVIEREAVDRCDCGGTLYEVEIATGETIVATWDPETFDSDEYELTTTYERTERRVECDRCGGGWSF